MDHDLMNSLRLTSLLGSFLLGVQLAPDLSQEFSRHVLLLLLKIRRFYRELWIERKAAPKKTSFWEIDMTKFEP